MPRVHIREGSSERSFVQRGEGSSWRSVMTGVMTVGHTKKEQLYKWPKHDFEIKHKTDYIRHIAGNTLL